MTSDQIAQMREKIRAFLEIAYGLDGSEDNADALVSALVPLLTPDGAPRITEAEAKRLDDDHESRPLVTEAELRGRSDVQYASLTPDGARPQFTLDEARLIRSAMRHDNLPDELRTRVKVALGIAGPPVEIVEAQSLTPDGEIEKLKAQNGVLKQRWRTLLALQMQAKSIEEIDGDPVIADMRSVEIQHPIPGESKPLPAGSRSAETIMQPLIDAVDRLLDVDGRGGAPEEIAHAIGDVSTARAIAETRAENQLQCELASLISAYETLRQAAQQLDTALTDEFRNTERPHGLADDPSHDDHIDSAWRALRQLLAPDGVIDG